MAITVVLRSRAYDYRTIVPGSTSAEFFHDRDTEGADSAAALTERWLVDWASRTDAVRELIVEVLGLPLTTRAHTHVVEPFVKASRKPGDIDMMICDHASPDSGIALEFKRVKVRGPLGAERVNKLEAAEDAKSQVKPLCELGFSRTYLGVIVIVDGRDKGEHNFLFRGLTPGTFTRVFKEVRGIGIPEAAGIMYVEIVQPVDRDLTSSGLVAVGILREAKRRTQQGDLTARLANYMRV